MVSAKEGGEMESSNIGDIKGILKLHKSKSHESYSTVHASKGPLVNLRFVERIQEANTKSKVIKH